MSLRVKQEVGPYQGIDNTVTDLSTFVVALFTNKVKFFLSL